ncbi:peptide-binding protein [Chryseobacterium sp. Leaf404]|uniref:PDZ domain-containing protein n=1 Tax=unclassified Chryseobacterium TaxID=2593645 RepID=UPI0006F2FAE4|nr:MULTISPECIES: PDZ domain-containing protein [unclassified Chryseobacterium]KQT20567.1 peptide-binding protein [Chryseobacterium sp. Leaf404]
MKPVGILFFLLVSIFFNAQNSFEMIQPKKVTIPFKLINNLIFIQIEVNGVELTFFVDSGVNETTIFSLENKEIKFSNLEKTTFTGLGTSGSIDGFKSEGNTAKIGKNLLNKDFYFYIISDPEFNISSHIGIPVNGIIGYQFFKNHQIIIDYEGKKMTLFSDDQSFKSKVKKFEELPITIEKSKPYILADVEMTNTPKSSKLLLDLGNTDAIWLFPKLIKDFVYNRPNIEDYLGRGFNGDIFGKRSRIHQLSLGKFKFEKPLIAMPDEYSIQNLNLVKDRKGSIGSEILRRFTLAFDYKNEKLYLKKNRNFNDPFHFNMSGIDFKQDGMQWEQDLMRVEAKKSMDLQSTEVIANTLQYKFVLKPIFSVAGVRKDSPGALAGLQKDDLLIKINGKKTTDMTLQKIVDLMKSDEGRAIEMEIERKFKPMKIRFILEDPIPYQE